MRKAVAIPIIILLAAGCVAGGYFYMQLSDQLTDAQSDINSLQSDYDAAQEELASIKEVYPPRNFNSEAELREWRTSVGLLKEYSVPEGYIKLQEMALSDGYIVSVRLFQEGGTWYFSGLAVAGNSFYAFLPTSLELVYLRDVELSA